MIPITFEQAEQMLSEHACDAELCEDGQLFACNMHHISRVIPLTLSAVEDYIDCFGVD